MVCLQRSPCPMVGKLQPQHLCPFGSREHPRLHFGPLGPKAQLQHTSIRSVCSSADQLLSVFCRKSGPYLASLGTHQKLEVSGAAGSQPSGRSLRNVPPDPRRAAGPPAPPTESGTETCSETLWTGHDFPESSAAQQKSYTLLNTTSF